MFQEFYQGSRLLIFPVIGLVIFFLSFLCVLGYIFIGLRSKEKVERIAALPLEDETRTEANKGRVTVR